MFSANLKDLFNYKMVDLLAEIRLRDILKYRNLFLGIKNPSKSIIVSNLFF